MHYACELLSVERLEALIGLTQVVGLAKVVSNLGSYFRQHGCFHASIGRLFVEEVLGLG